MKSEYGSTMSSRSKSQRAGILAVALLAGVSVRLDDIYYRRPLDQWAWIDWVVATVSLELFGEEIATPG